MKQPDLTPRQRHVLSAIVKNFIMRAEPVSSKLLSSNASFRESSATIRKTMAELEHLGLIEHPHTSAGRLPTDLGYRTYVDDLIQLEELSQQEKELISEELGHIHEENAILQQAANLLSRISNQLGLAASPSLENGILTRLSLVPLAEKKVMLVLSISDLLIRSIMVELDIDLPPTRLLTLEQRLNEKLRGKSVSFLNSYLQSEPIDAEREGDYSDIRIFSRSILKLLGGGNTTNVQLSGTKNILTQHEFERIEDIEGILELVDSKITLVHLLRTRSEHGGVYVTIGAENEGGIFRSYSIITSTFNMGGVQGTVGVIGPKRMPYSRLISIVDYTASTLNRKLGGPGRK